MQRAADAVELVAWWTAAAVACEVVVSTLASVLRRAVPRWRHRSALDRATPLVVRRTLDRAFGLSLTAALGVLGTTGPVSGASPYDAPPRRGVTAAAEAPYVRGSVTGHRPVAPAPSEAEATGDPEPTHHVIAPGEHLWAIARHTIEQRGGAAGDTRAVAQYWARLVRTNRRRLRSGNPSLVFAGEVLELPPVDPTPR